MHGPQVGREADITAVQLIYQVDQIVRLSHVDAMLRQDSLAQLLGCLLQVKANNFVCDRDVIDKPINCYLVLGRLREESDGELRPRQ